MVGISHVYTLAYVAEMLGEDEEWLGEICDEMDPEDGYLWIYGINDEQTEAFTDFGIETLSGVIREYKANPDLLPRPPTKPKPDENQTTDEIQRPETSGP